LLHLLFPWLPCRFHRRVMRRKEHISMWEYSKEWDTPFQFCLISYNWYLNSADYQTCEMETTPVPLQV
jgi:hypothetical protein